MITSQQADAAAGDAAAYVHIPFCASVCPYCDFAVVAGRDDLAERYIAAVISEVEAADAWRPLSAVYFGGGTPSHVPPSMLARVLEALEVRHGIASGAEVSLEANPEDFHESRAVELVAAGFNRVSFGAQSFDDSVLGFLGRRHDADQIGRAVSASRTAGFENVSLDLIYGAPGETDSSWSASLGSAVGLEPDHLSCYALTVEAGTPLGRSVRAGGPSPDPDVQASRYEAAEAMLFASGYQRYEVSNWSHPGRECRYNLTIWAQGEYEAYGNGAHGYRKPLRYRNYRRLDEYLASVEEGRPSRAGADLVEGWDQELDRLFVGLRRSVGVEIGPGTDALVTGEDGKRLIDAGVLEAGTERLVVARPLLGDEVNRAVLGLEPPRGWEHGASGDNVQVRDDA